jgi:hypothetical protein
MADGSLGLLKYDHLTTSWTVGGIAASAEQLRLIDWSIWLWKVVPNRPKVSHKHSEGNAATDTINWTIVQDMTKPEGQQLYTIGDPEEYGININPITA